ncbi:hypothetical protein ACHQM5_007436 [Ranunculus cassubicifolius]
MAKVCAVSSESSQQQQGTSSTATPSMPPSRRPRVREVSSRFMSPIVTSSSSGDLHVPSSKHTASPSTHLNQQQRSHSAQRREAQLGGSGSYADENRLDTARSLDTPFGSLNRQTISLQKKHQQHQHCDGQQLRTLCNSNKFPMRGGNFTRSRQDTPIVHSRDRMTCKSQYSPRSSNVSVASVASTAAAKLVQMSGMSTDASLEAPKCVRSLDLDPRNVENPSSSDTSESKTFLVTDQESRSSSPARFQNSRTRPLSDVRSSMPEKDMLPTISSKFLAHNRDTPKASAFPAYRSLNSPLPCFEQQPPCAPKSVFRSSTSGMCLPPQPPNKVGLEGKKGVKVSNNQEQVHLLRMLYNHHLQWRYANARAEAATNAQSIAATKSVHAIATKISELHDSVDKKRVEIRQLKKERNLSTVLEAQMPYLDEWSSLEGEYSTSLAGAIKALQDASIRLPIIGNVKANPTDVGKALSSAANMMELMSSFVSGFMPKGEEMDNLISELDRVVNQERALIEECGDLLSRTHALQVTECSLRGQLLQLKQTVPMEQTQYNK